jgi:hypothetical protein
LNNAADAAHATDAGAPVRAPVSRFARIAPVLALVPLGLACAFVLRSAVDIPFADEWTLVYLIDHAYAGTLRFAELTASHVGHRLLLPRLVIVLLARLTHWDVRWELALNLLALLALFGVAVRATRPRPVTLVLLALYMGSLAQWYNLLHGLQICICLAQLTAVTGLALLGRARLRARELVGALLCGTAALYSFSTGLAFFAAAVVVLLARRARRTAVAGFAAGAAVVVASFFGLLLPRRFMPGLSTGPHVVFKPGSAGQAVIYALTLLGHPVPRVLGLWARPVAAVAALCLCASLVRQRDREVQGGRFALGLAVYAVLSAVVVAAARAGLGVGQATESRYYTLALPLWLALIIRVGGGARGWRDWRGWLGATLAVLSLALSVEGASAGLVHAELLRTSRAAMLGGQAAGVSALYPNVGQLLGPMRRAAMRDGLTCFRAKQ